jgi:hypothetical protein
MSDNKCLVNYLSEVFLGCLPIRSVNTAAYTYHPATKIFRLVVILNIVSNGRGAAILLIRFNVFSAQNKNQASVFRCVGASDLEPFGSFGASGD